MEYRNTGPGRRFSAKVKIIVFDLVRCFRADVKVFVQLRSEFGCVAMRFVGAVV